jgi:hypothetical protein
MANPIDSPYEQLDFEKREIRLIILQPGHSDDPVVCNLSATSLNRPSHYEALSYVWGDQNITSPIAVEGTPVQATQNLELALRHIRHVDKERMVWIDAICINQRDDDERTQQVSLMRAIYGKASEVVVWLGPHHASSGKAISFIEAAAADVERHWKTDMKNSMAADVLNAEHIAATATSLRRPWLSRVWTVQECVLASRLTFLVGDSAISGEAFSSFERSWRRHVNTCGCIDFRISYDLVTAMGATSNMMELRDVSAREKMAFSRMLRLFQNRQCTDQRDRIYGLLGMATGFGMSADYALSVAEVFERYFVDCVARTGELYELSYNSQHRDTQIQLSSWVPNWMPPTNHEEDGWMQVRELFLSLYSAGRDVELSFSNPRPGTAVIKGILIDCIETVTSAPRLKSPDLDTSQYLRWFDLLKSAIESHDRYSISEAEALFHRIICNTRMEQDTPEGKLAPKRISGTEFLSVFRKWFQVVKDEGTGAGPEFDDRLDREATLYFTTVLGSTIGRGLCVSQTGYLGLTTPEARRGDVLVVFGGSRVPYVLRPLGEFKVDGNVVYKFVGDAYVEGIMDGEAMKDEDVHGRLQDFTLV